MKDLLQQLDQLEQLAAAATPGPWIWAGHPDSLRLCTAHGGQRFVMTFARRGMRDAQPCFQIKGQGMVNAADLLQFEVGNQSVVGLKAASADGSGVYRTDVRGIAHPDAQFIACFNPAVALELIQAVRALAAPIEVERGAEPQWLDPNRGPSSEWKGNTQILHPVLVAREEAEEAELAYWCDMNDEWISYQRGERELIYDVEGWLPLPALPAAPLKGGSQHA